MKAITLKCTSCGADLEIPQDMDRFACGYCGAQQVVWRQGGIIAIKLVTDAISRVQSGTDRTAAELAIRRLNDELAMLDIEIKQRSMDYSPYVVSLLFFIIGAVLLSNSFVLFRTDFIIPAIWAFIIAIPFLCLAVARLMLTKRPAEIALRRQSLLEKLKNQKTIVGE